MIRGSDGYEYEDLTARLVGRRADTARNHILGGASDSEFKADYVKAYGYYESSGYSPEVCHRIAFAQAYYLERTRAHDPSIPF